MAGLLVLVMLVIYGALTVYLGVRASRISRKYLSIGWPFGALVGFIMFGLVFWDAIPTWYTHYHLCATEAGLKVYQTPEEWAKENPERYQQAVAVAGRKVIRRSGDTKDAIHSWIELAPGIEYEYFLQRKRNYAFQTGIERNRVTDKITGKVLFETIDFSSAAGTSSLASGANSLADYKFWTATGLCGYAQPSLTSRFKYNGQTFSDLLKVIEGWSGIWPLPLIYIGFCYSAGCLREL